MKKLVLTLVFICICLVSYANNQPKVGDQLIIKDPSGQYYNHISFPQLNILVKRGKLASYTAVVDNVVVVVDVITKANNKTYIVLKKKDGTKFFGLKTTVKANYTKALESGELVLVDN